MSACSARVVLKKEVGARQQPWLKGSLATRGKSTFYKGCADGGGEGGERRAVAQDAGVKNAFKTLPHAFKWRALRVSL